MGALSLLRAMRSAAAGSTPRSPNLSCGSLLKRGELLHLHDTGAPLPAAPIPSGLAVGRGVTHNVSPSGWYFATDSKRQVGGFIDFEIVFDTPGDPMKFRAQGQIVRIEPQGSRTGVGVKLLASRMVPAA